MKKYIAVFDGYRVAPATIEYAIELSAENQAHLVGVFLDEYFYHNYNYYQVLTSKRDYQQAFRKLDAADEKRRDRSVRLFEESCRKAGIQFSIHRDTNIAIQELIRESMFADLVIINKHETFNRNKETPPTGFIRDLLGRILCPVLLVPWLYKKINSVALLYDGRPSSLYAIKMFSYLFPESGRLPVEIFTVKSESRANLHLPENKLMREFIKRHFPKAKYKVVKGNAEEKIVERLSSSSENELVVLGAYHRSEVSRWFRESAADILMKEVNSPLFIAHSS